MIIIKSQFGRWWIFLFETGSILEASYAQRYAVPKIHDIISAINSERIMSIYGDVINPTTQEPVPKMDIAFT